MASESIQKLATQLKAATEEMLPLLDRVVEVVYEIEKVVVSVRIADVASKVEAMAEMTERIHRWAEEMLGE